MGFIYKIQNKLNGKLYIGKTCTTIANRWNHHLDSYSKKDWHLYRAMRKYGIENFIIEPIEQCPDSLLNEREIYWIEKLNTFYTGYNETLGGEGRTQISREDIKHLWESGLSVKAISEQLGIWSTSVIDILKQLDLYDSNEVAARKQIEIANSQSNFCILQYTSEGQLVNKYKSVYEASILTNITAAAIRAAIYQGVGANGYFWIKEGDPLPNFRPIKTYPKRNIKQINFQGEVVAIYPNAAEAARQTGANSSGILKACKGQRKTCGGYKWTYDE